MTIQLGQKAKDKITGFEGIVVGLVQYINGCNQALLSPPVGKDGAYVDGMYFDQQRLTITDETPMTFDNGATPGFDKSPPKM